MPWLVTGWCLFLAVALSARPILAQENELREKFGKAYLAYTQRDFSAAKEGFQKTVDGKFGLADYSLYYLALIASNEKKWDVSRQLLSQLRRSYPQSVWFYAAALQWTKIDLAENKPGQAAERLRRLRADKGVKNEILEEALYLLGQTQETQGNSARAYALYQELRDQYPRSRWTPAARKEQARLRAKDPGTFGLHTSQAMAEEAERLTREREYGEAEILYKKLIDKVSEPDLRLDYVARLSRIYLATRKRNEAIPLLNVIALEFPETAEAPRALYEIGHILWNRHDNGQALEQFKLLLERYPTSAYTERARYNLGDIYESFGNKDEAIEFYRKAIALSATTQVREDARWRLAWLYYRSGDWQGAFTEFAELAAQPRESGPHAAARYWQARTAEKLGDEDAAKNLYTELVKFGEESYYQVLAARALQRMGVSPESAKPPPSAFATTGEPEPPLSPEVRFHLRRGRELAAIGLHKLAVVELDEIQLAAKTQPRLRPLLMREYFQVHAYARSLAIANQLPGSNGERNLYRFPLAFWNMIQPQAEQRGLDPYLVLALIRQESLFDATARSPAAALGLMQLLPSTASRVARQIGMPAPAAESLFEPSLNVTLGTQYLKDLLQRYSNNWFKAIAAYNAGEAAVDRWEREIATDDIEEFVERIPYVETRGYVKLVMRNHRVYKSLYDNNPRQ
jgi:soluble lytic murein transglycosylase